MEFLNNADLQRLNASLDELDEKTKEIFVGAESDLDNVFVKEIESRNAEFLVWFSFLRANFLRGKDTLSNKAFRQFIDFCKREENGYYFKEFPTGNDLIPPFEKPKFRHANQVEEVLRQVRKNHGSGRGFVRDIRRTVEKNRTEIGWVYLELVSEFMSYKEIALKIANAIIGEPAYQLRLLREYGKKRKFEMLTTEEWIKSLNLASCFNVMIDVHVRNFFKNHGMKSVDHFTLLLIAREIRHEVIELLFRRSYPWFDKKTRNFLLKNYHDYTGANMVEKLIWVAYFVRANSSKKENIDSLKFYRLSKGIFK